MIILCCCGRVYNNKRGFTMHSNHCDQNQEAKQAGQLDHQLITLDQITGALANYRPSHPKHATVFYQMIQGLLIDLDQAYSGNKSACRRARVAIIELKKRGQLIRKELLEISKHEAPACKINQIQTQPIQPQETAPELTDKPDTPEHTQEQPNCNGDTKEGQDAYSETEEAIHPEQKITHFTKEDQEAYRKKLHPETQDGLTAMLALQRGTSCQMNSSQTPLSEQQESQENPTKPSSE